MAVKSSKSGTAANIPAVRITRTKNTCRISFNKPFVEKMQFKADAEGNVSFQTTENAEGKNTQVAVIF